MPVISTNDPLLGRCLFVTPPSMFSGTHGSIPCLCEVVDEKSSSGGLDPSHPGYKTLQVKPLVQDRGGKSLAPFAVYVALNIYIQEYEGE